MVEAVQELPWALGSPARHRCSDDRAHDRDPQRAADLPHAVQDRRADAGLVGRYRAASPPPSSGSSPRHPDAAEQHRRAAGPRSSSCASMREKRISDPVRTSHPADHERPRAPNRSDSRPAMRREEDDQDRPRQERRARLDRRVAEHVLDVERDVEEDAEHRERRRAASPRSRRRSSCCGRGRARASAAAGSARAGGRR